MDEEIPGPEEGDGVDQQTHQKARRLRAFGEELMDRGDLTAAAEVLTRALVLFLQLERKDEVQTTERLLTRVVPQIGPFVYAEIRRTVEVEMGVRPPEEDKPRRSPRGR